MTTPQKQNGVTLLVTMIMLILITLFAISTYKTSSNNIRVVGNMQTRQEGSAAAQQAIELVISSDTFTTDPALVSQSPIDADIDGDGVVDYVVRVTPSCVRATLLPSCGAGAANSSGVSGVLIEGLDSGGAGTCYMREWKVRALVTDLRTGLTVTVNQGVAVPSSDATCT